MPTTIHYNGSRSAGSQPATIEHLLQVLAEHPLDPAFEGYIWEPEGGTTTVFFGNFLTLSNAFRIATDEASLVESLTAAIQENCRRRDEVDVLQPQTTQGAGAQLPLF